MRLSDERDDESTLQVELYAHCQRDHGRHQIDHKQAYVVASRRQSSCTGLHNCEQTLVAGLRQGLLTETLFVHFSITLGVSCEAEKPLGVLMMLTQAENQVSA